MINIRKILDNAKITYPSMPLEDQWDLFEEAYYMLTETHDTTKWPDDKLESKISEFIQLSRAI